MHSVYTVKMNSKKSVFVIITILNLLFNYTFSIVSDANLNSTDDDFDVAVIAAGSLRTFIFVLNSWEKYLFNPWRENLKLFASVIEESDKVGCPLYSSGLTALKTIATSIEVSSSVPLLPLDFVWESIPSQYKRHIKNVRNSGNGGKYIDMFARRIRAYELALAYEEVSNITFDAVLMIRFDTAFYPPILPLKDWYNSMLELQSFNISGVMIPYQCNFHGLCDRQTFGLSSIMRKYFTPFWPFHVLQWAITKKDDDVAVYRNKSLCGNIECNDWSYTYMNLLRDYKRELGKRKGPHSNEFLHLGWLFMNKWMQVFPNPEANFITLRWSYAESYCNLDKRQFLRSYKHMPLKTNAGSVHNMNYFEAKATPQERCGAAAEYSNYSFLSTYCVCDVC